MTARLTLQEMFSLVVARTDCDSAAETSSALNKERAQSTGRKMSQLDWRKLGRVLTFQSQRLPWIVTSPLF
jgi:hypothetical protein